MGSSPTTLIATIYRLGGLFALSFFAFIGVFLRQDLFAFDSYATWYVIKTGINDVLSYQDLAVFLFRLMPDSLLFFKFFMFASFFVSIIILFYLSKNYFKDERLAWISIFSLLAFSPLLMFEFAKFENELFAFPLILLGFYFLIINKSWKKLIGLLPLSLSCFFWLWPGYFFYNSIFGSLLLEQRMFGGLLNLFGLLVCVPFIVFEKNRWIKYFGLLFFSFFLFVPKLWIIYVPFLVISIGLTINKLSEKGYDLKNFVLVAIILLLGWNIALFLQQPTQNDWIILDKTIELHEDANFPIFNDWSVGHWLRIKGIETKYKSGGKNPDYNSIKKPFIALTQSNLDCNLQKNYENFTRNLNLYVCD